MQSLNELEYEDRISKLRTKWGTEIAKNVALELWLKEEKDKVVKLKEQLQAAEDVMEYMHACVEYPDTDLENSGFTAYQQKYHPEKGQTE